jgi:D-aspartate ligase
VALSLEGDSAPFEGFERSSLDLKPGFAARGAVILGGAHGSLAVARSLGRHGVPVWFLTHDHPIARYSRYASRSFDWPGPGALDAARWLIEFAGHHGLSRWVLFAGGDEEVRLIAQHHAILERAFLVASPPWRVARIAGDKRLTQQHAASAGVASPWSFYPRDRREVVELDCDFPVILKPTFRLARNAFTSAKAWRADDRRALLRRYDEAAALVSPEAIVIQELIPGNGEVQYSYAAVWSEGRPVASLVARRRRQYPIDFGLTSTFVETVEHAEIEDLACKFLVALRFSGLVELEFKYDVRDRQFKLLDVNPRPWTWIALGSAAGVDLPWIEWRLACGEPVAPSRGRAGVGWTHSSRDVVSAFQQIIAGDLRPRDYAASLLRSRTYAAFAIDDPVPAILDLPVLLARVLRRRFGQQRLAEVLRFPKTSKD